MIRSMTGHGRGTADIMGRRVTVELRSVNHRFLELKVRGGSLDPRLEDVVTQAIRKRLERGAVSIQVKDEGGDAGGVRPDLERAKAVHAALEAVRTVLAIAEPVVLADVMALPGVLIGGDAEDGEEVLAAARQAVGTALDELVAMRRREGEAIAAELAARVTRLAALEAEITELASKAPAEHAAKLRERVNQLLAGDEARVDAASLATQIALLADRLDVTEELVRLRSHLEQLRERLAAKDDAPVGRRVDFLLQEVGREINTIGSKAQSTEIARRVIEAKAELEKLREQIQNVE